MTHTIGYGLTEAGPALTHTSGEIPEEDSAIGPPLPGVELIPRVGEPGAGSGWMFRSPGAASAILPAGSTTWQPVQRDEAIPTGDLLEWSVQSGAGAVTGGEWGSVRGGDQRGYRFRGRTAWTFKKKGETLSPVWIEEALWAALRGEPQGEGTMQLSPDGLVIAPDADAAEEGIVLYVEGAPAPELARWIEAGIQGLPSFVRPDRILWLPDFPRNALGKIERGAIRSTDAGTPTG
jgi:acyl-CoA synthetase (AMP-forming)/AMP-acid ligase II